MHFNKGLRNKLLIIVAAGLASMLAMQMGAGHFVLLDKYAEMEEDKMLSRLDSAVNLLDEQRRQLDNITRDWAHWDDTHDYLTQPELNPEYIDSNYTDDSFANLGISVFMLVDLHGNIVFKKGLVEGRSWPIPSVLEQAASKGGILMDPARGQVSGLLWTPEGFLVVSASEVLRSGGKGERRGTFIMAKRLDDALLSHTGQLLGMRITVERAVAQALSPDGRAALTELQSAGGEVVSPLSDTEVAGYALLEDIGSPVRLLLRAVDDRKLFGLGKSSLQFFLWSVSLVVFVLAGFHWWFDRVVLTRFALLSGGVRRIGESVETLARVPALSGHDELATLAQGINDMLVRLDDTQRALHSEKERAQRTLEGIADAVIACDNAGGVVFMNAAAERLTGLVAEDALGRSMQSSIHLTNESRSVAIDGSWLTETADGCEEAVLERPDGKEFIVRKSVALLHDRDGGCFGTVTVLHDITELRELAGQLSFQARHDALTGLVNRYEFDRLVEAAIGDAARSKRVHCMAYIDLDQFKVVNDACGHMAGDMLLRQLAARLQECLRSSDTLARLGGDEFAVLLMGCSLHKAQEIFADLLRVIGDFRFVFESRVFRLGASIGLTEISPEHGFTLSELLGTVDSACYAAKDQGGNRIHVYRPGDDELRQRYSQLEWVSRIHEGLESDRFVLYCQRIQSLTGGEPHCELLIRMYGEDGTLYPPGYFLPAAERYRLMPLLDRWVVREAFSILASRGAEFSDVCSINLSGQTLSEEGFLDYVIEQMEQAGVDARRICFEITETSVIASLDKARQFMRALSRIGCRFSLDDFGSGLSSFAYLKQLEVDFLKIDGMFVKAIANNKIDRAMVSSINHVGHVMGLQTIAEFAENDEIIEVLKEIGVDYAQGYGVAKPELFR